MYLKSSQGDKLTLQSVDVYVCLPKGAFFKESLGVSTILNVAVVHRDAT